VSTKSTFQNKLIYLYIFELFTLNPKYTLSIREILYLRNLWNIIIFMDYHFFFFLSKVFECHDELTKYIIYSDWAIFRENSFGVYFGFKYIYDMPKILFHKDRSRMTILQRIIICIVFMIDLYVYYNLCYEFKYILKNIYCINIYYNILFTFLM
jgi:hypothetical protein